MTGNDDNRRAKRHEVLLSGRFRQSSWHVASVEIGNLSSGGCCIVSGARAPVEGQAVSLRIADLKAVSAKVCWVADDRCGLIFDTPLTPEVLSRLTSHYGIEISSA
ncbi:PilZ domain-containing protein [Novosphingobium sp. 9]|uniref:PilZ domain-containing protein n=1 Tax=Novosphingobium sp. 9 TaxID=2025349 RepID=UPI0021B6E5B8|nr:PilZ domain-containing protein [Novosphingobium sp. 9]